MTYWGYHLLLDCAGCNDSIKDKELIKQFVKELVATIEMTAIGDPIIELLLPGELNQGYSLMQLIATSNITAHFVDHDNTAYIDIFSCKEFSLELAKSIVLKYFNPNSVKETFIKRQA
jgi:S-adenosylmethionine/arginine decarboxylase-like enzyme